VVEQILHEDTIVNRGPPEFVLVLGDDSSDEPMFEALYSFMYETVRRQQTLGHIFTCTVGKKPNTNAEYYLPHQSEVQELLAALAEV